MNNNYDDFLDSKGKYKNFLTDNKFSSKYLDLANQWSKLPLYENKDEIKKFIKNLDNNQIILIKSGTGSGKTVLIPKFVLKYYTSIKKSDKLIAITNPKILTTVYNATYSANTLDVNLGEEVGYKYRNSPEQFFTNKTKLLYCTDGILLSKLQGDKNLSEFNTVIIDEVHEREIPIDLLIYYIKNILKNRPDFKLILMSATTDSKIFFDYFKDFNMSEQNISGKSNYPIISNWLDPKTSNSINEYNYINYGIQKILNIIESDKLGDILFFVSTQKETEDGCKKLQELCKSKHGNISKICDKYFCIEVFSKMLEFLTYFERPRLGIIIWLGRWSVLVNVRKLFSYLKQSICK